MSLQSMPTEIIYRIVDFLIPTKPTSEETRASARSIKFLSLVNTELYANCSDKLKDLKDKIVKIDGLKNKYNTFKEINPTLMDALYTGYTDCYTPKATFDTYTPEIEQDIQDIITLIPESMDCIGSLQNLYNVTPLTVACFNEKISLHVIRFMLENGANPNDEMIIDNGPFPASNITLLQRLKREPESERRSSLLKLLEEYQAE